MDNKKSLDDIIEEFNTKAEDVKREQPSYGYTYTGEHYDNIPVHSAWSKNFVSTQLAVDITSAISNAVKNGLDDETIAHILRSMLREVRNR